MLGKGLESLIPASQGDDSSGDFPQGFGQPAASPPEPSYPGPSWPATPKNSAPAVLSAQGGSASGGRKPKDEHEPQDFVFHIEVTKISPNPNQPRRNFDEEGIRDLANSVREFGFLQPLVVTRRETETPQGVEVSYELIAGERRFMAAKMLGLEVVPAIIRGVDLEREKLELAVIENIQRENLNPIEAARAFQRLQEEFRMTQREIASKLGKSRESVANTMRLLDLPPYIQEALEKGAISESHGRLLLTVQNPGSQQRLFEDIVTQGLTTREVKERVKIGGNVSKEISEPAVPPEARDSSTRPVLSKVEGPTATELPPELKMAEERLSSELGTPVKIETKGIPPAGGGKITITFYSEEELEGILRKIGGADQMNL